MKYKTLFFTYEIPQVGFIRYFLPTIQKTGFLKVRESELSRKGAEAIVKEELGVEVTAYSATDFVEYKGRKTEAEAEA